MINRTIVLQTVYELFLQPVILFVTIIGVALLLFITFAIDVQFQGDVLLSFQLLGVMIEGIQAKMFVESFLPAAYGMTTSILMFLLILACSFFFSSEMLKNPLLPIVLTKPGRRFTVFFSTFVGSCFLVLLLVFTLTLMIWALLYTKTEGNVSGIILLAGLSFWVEFVVIFALAALLSMVVEHTAAIFILVMAVYFYLAPLLTSSSDISLPLLSNVLSYLVPPVGKITMATRDIALSGALDPGVYLSVVPYLLLFLTAAALLFHHKELSSR
jgi:hypothetical protein